MMKPGYQNFVEPVRDMIRLTDRNSCKPFEDLGEWIFAKLQCKDAELAMLRAKEAGGTLAECMQAAIKAVFCDR